MTYVDSGRSGSPIDMETDCPLIDDLKLLKKTVEEEATQVRPEEGVGGERNPGFLIRRCNGFVFYLFNLNAAFSRVHVEGTL